MCHTNAHSTLAYIRACTRQPRCDTAVPYETRRLASKRSPSPRSSKKVVGFTAAGRSLTRRRVTRTAVPAARDSCSAPGQRVTREHERSTGEHLSARGAHRCRSVGNGHFEHGQLRRAFQHRVAERWIASAHLMASLHHWLDRAKRSPRKHLTPVRGRDRTCSMRRGSVCRSAVNVVIPAFASALAITGPMLGSWRSRDLESAQVRCRMHLCLSA